MSNRKRRGRGEGGVRFDESRNLWVASISLGYHADGRRNRPVAYGTTKKEALDELERIKREVGTRDGSALTVAELVDLWLGAKEGHVADSTHEGRVEASARVKAALGTRVARLLTPLEVTRFQQDAKKAGQSLSAVWHASRALHASLEYGVEMQIIPTNPASAVGLPPLPGREMVTLSQAQARELIETSAGYVAGPMIAVSLGTGLRQGELLGLCWPDVDLDAARLVVRRSLSRTKKGGFKLKEPKTKASRRTISLPEFVVTVLREMRREQQNVPPTRTIFCGPGGSHRHRGQLATHLKKTIRRAVLAGSTIPDGFTWHSMRHTHASLLLSAGHSLRAVSQRLGHTNPAFTLRLYAHCLPGDDERLAIGLQGILG